jgi:hypothetical protein
MPLFRRRKRSLLPSDVLAQMERVARRELEGGDDPSAIWQDILEPLLHIALADPDGFLAALADEVVPAGGLAAFGAVRTVSDIAPALGGSHYLALLDASIAFLRRASLPPNRVPGLEWERFLACGGSADTWLSRRPTPSPTDARITPLAPGETRRVAQIDSRSDSNVILVHRREDGRYESLIDARWSDEDAGRSLSPWECAETQYEVYVRIGLSLQAPCHWFDAELEPYFPLGCPEI